MSQTENQALKRWIVALCGFQIMTMALAAGALFSHIGVAEEVALEFAGTVTMAGGLIILFAGVPAAIGVGKRIYSRAAA